MRKLLCILLCLMLLPASVWAQDNASAAYVDGKTSDRVHLRSAASTQSASLGLFFTGTPVTCLSSRADTWTRVQIGTQKGYMMSEFLKSSGFSAFQMVGTVKGVNAALTVRKTPSAGAAAVCTVKLGDTVQVLGETKDQWCYVRAGAQHGYVKSQYLSVQAVWVAPENTAGAPTVDLQDPYMPVLQRYYLALLEQWSYIKLHNEDLCEMCELHYDGNPYATIGYMLKDMNADGIPELLIGSLSEEMNKNMLFSMYCLKNGKPALVTRSWARSRKYLCKDQLIYHEGSNSAFSSIFELMRLSEKNELEYLEITRYEGAHLEFAENKNHYPPDSVHWVSDHYIDEYPYGRLVSPEEYTANIDRYKSLCTQYPLTPFSTLQGTVGRIHYKGSTAGTTTVNIRQTPSTAGKILSAPKTGTTVSVLSAQNGWYEVYCGGMHGYIMADFVSVH